MRDAQTAARTGSHQQAVRIAGQNQSRARLSACAAGHQVCVLARGNGRYRVDGAGGKVRCSKVSESLRGPWHACASQAFLRKRCACAVRQGLRPPDFQGFAR